MAKSFVLLWFEQSGLRGMPDFVSIGGGLLWHCEMLSAFHLPFGFQLRMPSLVFN